MRNKKYIIVDQKQGLLTSLDKKEKEHATSSTFGAAGS